MVGDYAEGYEYEHDIQPGAEEEEFVGGEPARLALWLEETHEAARERQWAVVEAAIE